MAREQPLEFLKECIIRYQREVKSYRLKMSKQERIGRTEEPAEIIEVAFREEPFSVVLKWDEGARMAKRTLYVQGQNDGKLLVVPTAKIYLTLAKVKGHQVKDDLIHVDPLGEDALQSGRFPITTFGMSNGLYRLLDDWRWRRNITPWRSNISASRSSRKRAIAAAMFCGEGIRFGPNRTA